MTEAARSPVGYVGLISRVVAIVIDLVVINLIAALVGAMINLLASLLGNGGGLSAAEAVIGGVAWWLWVVAYFVTFWTLTGQTLGSRLLGMRVERPDGGGLQARQALRRFGGAILATIPLGAGFLLILVDDRRRGLQDRIGGTVVRWVPEEVSELRHYADPGPAYLAQPGLGSASRVQSALPEPEVPSALPEPEFGPGSAPNPAP